MLKIESQHRAIGAPKFRYDSGTTQMNSTAVQYFKIYVSTIYDVISDVLSTILDKQRREICKLQRGECILRDVKILNCKERLQIVALF